MGWPLPEGLAEADLEARLAGITHPRPPGTPPSALPHWAHVHAELRRPNVTLRLLWQEYIRSEPAGLKYSRFCERYQEWRKALEPTLRQVHVPGEKLFVDWAGQTVPIQNAADGTTRRRVVHFEYAPPDALDPRLAWAEGISQRVVTGY